MGFFKSSAHLLFWAFGLVVLTVAVGLALDIGLLGASAQARFHGFVAALRDLYGINRANIQLALQIIGLAFSILIGSLGFLRVLHYAEAALPRRIADHMAEMEGIALSDRATVLAPFLTYSIADRPAPPVPNGFAAILRYLGLDRVQRLTKAIHEGAETFDAALPVFNQEKHKNETQRVTAHLLRGLELAAEAAKLNDEEAREKDVEALDQFELALKINRRDHDALEHAARLLRRLDKPQQAKTYLERLARYARRRPTVLARAARLHSEICEDGGSEGELNQSRLFLEATLRMLAKTVTPSPAEDYEIGAVHERLAAIQLARERTTRVAPALDQAEACYTRLPGAHRQLGFARVAALRARLAAVGTDDDIEGN
jgi:hypothetical protein